RQRRTEFREQGADAPTAAERVCEGAADPALGGWTRVGPIRVRLSRLGLAAEAGTDGDTELARGQLESCSGDLGVDRRKAAPGIDGLGSKQIGERSRNRAGRACERIERRLEDEATVFAEPGRDETVFAAGRRVAVRVVATGDR